MNKLVTILSYFFLLPSFSWIIVLFYDHKTAGFDGGNIDIRLLSTEQKYDQKFEDFFPKSSKWAWNVSSRCFALYSEYLTILQSIKHMHLTFDSKQKNKIISIHFNTLSELRCTPTGRYSVTVHLNFGKVDIVFTLNVDCD